MSLLIEIDGGLIVATRKEKNRSMKEQVDERLSLVEENGISKCIDS